MSNKVAYTFVAVDKYTRVGKAVERQNKRLKRSFTSVQRAGGRAGRSIGGAALALGRFAKSRVALGGLAVLGSAVFASVKAYGSLEAALSDVETLMSDAEIKEFGGKLKKAGTDAILAGENVDDVGNALFNLVSILGASEIALETFGNTVGLAIGGKSNLTTAVFGAAKVVKAFGLQLGETDRATEGIFSAQQAGATNVEKLSTSVGRLEAASKDASLQAEEMLALFSRLTFPFTTPEAATSLAAMIDSLTSPTPEQRAIFKTIGIDASAAGIEAQGFLNVLDKIAASVAISKNNLAILFPAREAKQAASAFDVKGLKAVRALIFKIKEDRRLKTGLTQAIEGQEKTQARILARARGAAFLATAKVGVQAAPGVAATAGGVEAAATAFIRDPDFFRTLAGAAGESGLAGIRALGGPGSAAIQGANRAGLEELLRLTSALTTGRVRGFPELTGEVIRVDINVNQEGRVESTSVRGARGTSSLNRGENMRTD